MDIFLSVLVCYSGWLWGSFGGLHRDSFGRVWVTPALTGPVRCGSCACLHMHPVVTALSCAVCEGAHCDSHPQYGRKNARFPEYFKLLITFGGGHIKIYIKYIKINFPCQCFKFSAWPLANLKLHAWFGVLVHFMFYWTTLDYWFSATSVTITQHSACLWEFISWLWNGRMGLEPSHSCRRVGWDLLSIPVVSLLGAHWCVGLNRLFRKGVGDRPAPGEGIGSSLAFIQ